MATFNISFGIKDFEETLDAIFHDDSVYGAFRKKDIATIYRALEILTRSKEDVISCDNGCVIDMDAESLSCDFCANMKIGMKSIFNHADDPKLWSREQIHFEYSFKLDTITLTDVTGRFYQYEVAFKKVFTSYYSIFDNYKQYDHEIEACYLAYMIAAFLGSYDVDTVDVSVAKKNAILNQIRLYIMAAHNSGFELHKVAPICNVIDTVSNTGLAILFTYGKHGTEVHLNTYRYHNGTHPEEDHYFYAAAISYPDTDVEDRPILMHTEYADKLYQLMGTKYHVDFNDNFLVEFVNVSMIKIFNYHKMKHDS